MTMSACHLAAVIFALLAAAGHALNHKQHLLISAGNLRGENRTEFRPVFYLVVMGKAAESHFMQANIRALRELGKFTGPVVLVTDHKDCLVSNLGTKVLGEGNATYMDEDVTVFENNGASYHIVNVKSTNIGSRQGFEQHKALARSHCRRAHLPFELGAVIGMDEDILTTEPVHKFLDELHKVQDSGKPLAVFHDQGIGGQKYHCGMVISFPNQEAEKCMQEWLDHDAQAAHNKVEEASSKKAHEFHASDETDSSDLMGHGQKAFASTSCAKHNHVKLLNDKYFQFPTPDTLTKHKKRTFIHFTNTYRMKVLDKNQVQKFVKSVLKLDADILKEHKHPSCKIGGGGDGGTTFLR